MVRTTMYIEEISDRLEIQALLTRYAIAIDTHDWELLDTVFTPDAWIDDESSGGTKGRYPEERAGLAKILPSDDELLRTDDGWRIAEQIKVQVLTQDGR